jgi:hypothetical protein
MLARTGCRKAEHKTNAPSHPARQDLSNRPTNQPTDRTGPTNDGLLLSSRMALALAAATTTYIVVGRDLFRSRRRQETLGHVSHVAAEHNVPHPRGPPDRGRPEHLRRDPTETDGIYPEPAQREERERLSFHNAGVKRIGIVPKCQPRLGRSGEAPPRVARSSGELIICEMSTTRTLGFASTAHQTTMIKAAVAAVPGCVTMSIRRSRFSRLVSIRSREQRRRSSRRRHEGNANSSSSTAVVAGRARAKGSTTSPFPGPPQNQAFRSDTGSIAWLSSALPRCARPPAFQVHDDGRVEAGFARKDPGRLVRHVIAVSKVEGPAAASSVSRRRRTLLRHDAFEAVQMAAEVEAAPELHRVGRWRKQGRKDGRPRIVVDESIAAAAAAADRRGVRIFGRAAAMEPVARAVVVTSGGGCERRFERPRMVDAVVSPEDHGLSSGLAVAEPAVRCGPVANQKQSSGQPQHTRLGCVVEQERQEPLPAPSRSSPSALALSTGHDAGPT